MTAMFSSRILIHEHSSEGQPESSSEESHLLYWLRVLFDEVDALNSTPAGEKVDKVAIPETLSPLATIV